MTTPPSNGNHVPDRDAHRAEPTAVSLDKPAVAEEPFNPYRFGLPDYPIAPEYAPPGYVPPPPNPQQTYPPYGIPPPPPPPYPATNGKAVAALVLGALSIPLCLLSVLDLVLIIPAVVLGSVAISEAKRPGATGRGMATAGFVCALVGAVLAMTITVWIYPKVARCQNDYPRGSTEYNTCIHNILPPSMR
jgi:hypothetical protein